MDFRWFLFWAFLGIILGPILGPDRPKRGQDEPKRAIRSSKSQEAAFSKTLKNLPFFSVFGCRGLPRESQEARQGSQETPKETPKGVQNLVKKWLKSEPKNEQTNTISMIKISLWPARSGAIFEAMGPSKNAYFEDVKKLFKMPKNDPKIIQTWLKIAQIV